MRLSRPPPGELGQPGRYVDTVRLHRQPTFGAPGRHGFHQQPVRAADVEERPVGADPLGDVPAALPPRLLVAAESGALLGRLTAQVRPLQGAQVAGVETPTLHRPVRPDRGPHRRGQRGLTVGSPCAGGVQNRLGGRGGPPRGGVDDPAYGAFLWCVYFSDATLTFPQALVLRYSQLEPEERRNPQVAGDYAKWFLGRLRVVEAATAHAETLPPSPSPPAR